MKMMFERTAVRENRKKSISEERASKISAGQNRNREIGTLIFESAFHGKGMVGHVGVSHEKLNFERDC